MSLCSIAAAPVLISLAILPLGALLYPKLEFAGVMRAPIELNNQGCTTISGKFSWIKNKTVIELPENSQTKLFWMVGLEACEDAWISESNGLAYLWVIYLPCFLSFHQLVRKHRIYNFPTWN